MLTQQQILDLGLIAQDAYSMESGSSYNGYSHLSQSTSVNIDSGFTANSYYNSENNTLVIAFAGTDPTQFGDLAADLMLAQNVAPSQAVEALNYAQAQIGAFDSQGITEFDVVFTGHSLGGYLAQHVQLNMQSGSAVVYNSPGVPSSTTITEYADIAYVYSDPSHWSAADAEIHTLGNYVGNEIYVIGGASGHSIVDLNQSLAEGEGFLSPEELIASFRSYVEDSGNFHRMYLFTQFGNFGAFNEAFEEGFKQAVRNECFSYDTAITLANGSSKNISSIRPGDIVTSYDANGNLVRSKVTRTFVNEATHILDFLGTGVTPGHVFFCGEGRFKGQHVTLLDILRSDGGVVDASGKIIRACTGDEVGSDNDTTFVWSITGTPQPDGTVTIADRKQLRLSTRVITKDGRDLSLADIIFAMNATVTDTGMIRPNGSDAEVPLHWTFTPNLPAPEDYVLQRSGVTLEDIFTANEWEQRPKLPAPTHGEAGPSFVKSVEDVKGMFG
ncbi:MAG: Mbeg1-like protein [Paracoccaceae bacterium]|uniref:Mbeg1-like protein n=1 Tax=Ascidiaceihabitans sp. TaxID=1872644 RepID=UPI00329A79AE